jgi:hypothetical protein
MSKVFLTTQTAHRQLAHAIGNWLCVHGYL